MSESVRCTTRAGVRIFVPRIREFGLRAPNEFLVPCGNEEALSVAELKPGLLLKARYRITQVIGQGAMGAVYMARDEVLCGATWALKVLAVRDLKPQEVSEAVALFRREADICARLRHPGLPEIVDFFAENGYHVLVMELIQGQTLDFVVERRGRPLTEAELLPLLVQAASCLQYLHTQQPHPIVFRDLKPSNCMVTVDGKLKLIDFGIARYYKPGRKSDTIIIGTPGFCAPEQYGGGQTDPRSDIYSLGAMAWHLLSGQDPASVGLCFPPLRQVAPECSEGLEAILARCVSFDAAGRYPSAADLLDDLRWVWRQSQPRASAATSGGVWRNAPANRYTNRLHRVVNQHLVQASPAQTSIAPSTAFVPVRPTDQRARGRCVDAGYIREWTQSTFRLWWGHGSINAARIMVLFLVVMVMNSFAHAWLEDGFGALSPRITVGQDSRVDRCIYNLERIRDALAAYKMATGRYPSTLWMVLHPPPKCGNDDYIYDVSADRNDYKVFCAGHHPDLPYSYPRLESRYGVVRTSEDP